jgi:hypothetical protein
MNTKTRGGINLLPIILIAVIIYIIIKVDIQSVFESEQFKKNKSYVQNLIKTEVGEKFFKTSSNPDTNKSATFDLKSFLPQINDINTPVNLNTESSIPEEENFRDQDTGYSNNR